MRIVSPRDSLFLFVGDIIFFTLALWMSLLVRFGEIPNGELFMLHLSPFFIMFLIWAIVFVISDLYGVESLIFKHTLPKTIFQAQSWNSLLAVLFFYFIPYFGITPKTILFIDLLFSFILIFLWRLYVSKTLYRGRSESALLIGNAAESQELRQVLEKSTGSHLSIVNSELPEGGVVPVDSTKLVDYVDRYSVSLLVLDFRGKEVETMASHLYRFLFSKVKFLDFQALYEEVFGRVPLSLVSDRWVLENISYHPKRAYTIGKRIMDIFIAGALGALSTLLYPFVALLIKLDDGGPVFIAQERVGKDGELIRLLKFRTMQSNDLNKPTVLDDPRITRVGEFLRRTRIDELPQLWAVVRGDLSLVGPRPELPHFVEQYRKEIPFYDVRHIIQPGLSGWAQIRYDVPAYSAETNAKKLAYELYYIKNRSFFLDLRIALKTIKTLLSRKGI